MPTLRWEVSVRGYRDRGSAVAAAGTVLEDWLRSSLIGLALLDQPFACQFHTRQEARVFAQRMLALDFATVLRRVEERAAGS